jgi:hypothetical protein
VRLTPTRLPIFPLVRRSVLRRFETNGVGRQVTLLPSGFWVK